MLLREHLMPILKIWRIEDYKALQVEKWQERNNETYSVW